MELTGAERNLPIADLLPTNAGLTPNFCDANGWTPLSRIAFNDDLPAETFLARSDVQVRSNSFDIMKENIHSR